MIYEELKALSLAIDNEISFEEFQVLSIAHGYNEEYTLEIWERWCKSPLFFMCTHQIGKEVFELIQNKIQMKNLLA